MRRVGFFFLFCFVACVHGGQTSVTDEAGFRAFCAAAAQNDDVFSTFKRHSELIRVMQHVNPWQGQGFLGHIEAYYPYLLGYLEVFQEEDALGEPELFDFAKYGTLSPTLVRYVKIAGDLGHLFGNLNGKRVIEIGGGYGGQCHILSRLFFFKEYVLVDLPEVLALAKRYLDALGVRNVTYVTPDEVQAGEEYDVVISNYAFSECERSVQIQYLDQILAHSKSGYLTCNQINYFNTPPFIPMKLMKELKKRGVSAIHMPEIPKTSDLNYLIVWSN